LSLFSLRLLRITTQFRSGAVDKWPVFLQNAFGNPVYVNQTNLNGKLRKQLGGQTGAKQKSGGAMAHPVPPLRIATGKSLCHFQAVLQPFG